MLHFIADKAYVFWILVLLFGYLYYMGGDDIIFFRKKKHEIDPKASENLADALNGFIRSRDFKVMGPTTIEFEGKEYSFDSLLFTYSGIVAFSLQPQIGETYADLASDEWTTLWQGNRTKMANPLKAMEVNEKLFKDLFRAESVKYIKVQNFVVFTNKDANVVAPRTLPVCHANDLAQKLSDKCLADNGANIQGMMDAIEKYKK